MLISAQLGLFPDSLLGEAYLVPFKNNKNRTSDAQLIIGYKGLMKLAYQTNQFSNIYAKEICENDDYYYSFGLKPELKHIPAANNRGKIIYYYAVANFVNGGGAFEVMSVEDIKEHMKKYSKAFSAVSSPWQTNFDAMAMKTVIRKLVKFLPRSTDNLMQAVKHDEHAEICTQADFIDVDFDTVDEPVEPKKKKSDEVAEKLNNTSIPTEPSAEPEKPEPLSKENQAFVDEMGGVDNV